jgi:type VI secretion system protein ImpL
MISRIAAVVTFKHVLVLLAIAVLVTLLLLDSSMIKPAIGIVLAISVSSVLVVWGRSRFKAIRASEGLKQLISNDTAQSDTGATQALRERLQAAIADIKSSRMGRLKGSAALYELPWYLVIGNPAAGKSTAILNSGLHFPFTDQKSCVVQGIGGTRNCDWYFTNEGILLDTAGRYSVEQQDHGEWISFLHMLRKHRARAPINGIIIAASIAELIRNPPEFAIELAKKLRLRIQELTDNLEVIAPVYIVFTKADLIDGFSDFFRALEPAERAKVWGSTFAFQTDGSVNPVGQFEAYFDELCDGLKEMSLAQMAISRGKPHAPGLLTLPIEFEGLKSCLRSFLTTLFEENPYQYRPVVRGFYFTSAAQEGASVHKASDEIVKSFGLGNALRNEDADQQTSRDSYFLLDLFRKVIFADSQLVRQYSSAHRTRRRFVVVLGTALLLGGGLGGWAMSYTNNRQLVNNVQADLQKAILMQQDRVDLQARLEALDVLQDRFEQLQKYKKDHPLMLGLGLYQGDALELKLRQEYFNGMSHLMLKPVAEQMEDYLSSVGKNAAQLKLGSVAQTTIGGQTGGVYQSASPTDVQEAYNALKAYLMLGNAQRVEPVHLGDQLTRFWRHWLEANRGVMDREVMARHAERLMSFYISQSAASDWPTLVNKVTLVDDTRRALSGVMQGMPARDRVYAEIKARAATRFPSISVAGLITGGDEKIFAGSYAISGTFSLQAWKGYVQQAIRDASNKELNTTDWVLQSARSDDLTLSGSPEHIQKELEQLYTQEYIAEWRKFLQGITVAGFGDFKQANLAMNQLGDPQNSPMRKLMEAVYLQTSWDNPSLFNESIKGVKAGFWSGWFGSSDEKTTPVASGDLAVGPVGREFSGIARLMIAREGAPSLLQNYLEVLSRIRTRLNAIQTQGNPGPGARDLVSQTLDASAGSELSAGLTLVDEQLLASMDDSQRRTLRPLLLWPMIQTFSAIIPATQRELNQVWKDQVYEPFQQSLAGKYPFAPNGQIEASSSEISAVFGPQGAISKFASESLGPLVIRRGNVLASKQWADVGVNLAPSLMTNFAQWVAPLGELADGGSTSIFQILPGSAIGFSEYTLLIGDQQLRYRNTPAQWSNFAWDNSKANQTVKVSVVTYDGRTQDVATFSGQNALGQLIQSANGRKKPDGSYELQWTKGEWSVPVSMKIISNPQANADGSQRQGLTGTQLPLQVVGAQEFMESGL